ncbi:MAG: histidinol-phosphatase HisJ [Ignavibacteriales bacterium]|nr:histidinol-phosphatase HisJ [Ignavibacteriales bacterium]
MIVDYHTHTSLCKHAEGELGEYVQQAIAVGLDEIGCSEHIPMPDGFDREHRMEVHDYYSLYAPRVTELRERFRTRIAVRRGIEADFYPGTEEWVSNFVRENDLDYVIGSVHFLGDWGFDNPVFVHRYDEQDVNEVYERYFDAIGKSASSGLFDIIGHFDLVKKFGYRPTRNMKEIIWEALKTVRTHDLCVEINTSGLRKPVGEIYPDETILEMARQLEIPLTLGSDAHTPADVARDFDKAVSLAERYGRGRIVTFDKRERKEVKISRLAAPHGALNH